MVSHGEYSGDLCDMTTDLTDSGDASVGDYAAGDVDSVGGSTMYANELLCFMQQKYGVLSFDDLVLGSVLGFLHG